MRWLLKHAKVLIFGTISLVIVVRFAEHYREEKRFPTVHLGAAATTGRKCWFAPRNLDSQPTSYLSPILPENGLYGIAGSQPPAGHPPAGMNIYT